jgi:hypothetical protein
MNKFAATIYYLLGNVPTEIKTRSKNYDPSFSGFSKNRWIYKVGDYIVRIKIPRIANKLKVTLTTRQLDKLRKIKQRDIKVSCTCKFWKNNGPDYNANQQGYSERSFSNLASPDVRDPDRQFLICKHVFAALSKFKKDFSIAE